MFTPPIGCFSITLENPPLKKTTLPALLCCLKINNGLYIAKTNVKMLTNREKEGFSND